MKKYKWKDIVQTSYLSNEGNAIGYVTTLRHGGWQWYFLPLFSNLNKKPTHLVRATSFATAKREAVKTLRRQLRDVRRALPR